MIPMKYEKKKIIYKNILTVIAITAVLLTVLLFALNYPVSERIETEEIEVIMAETSFARWEGNTTTYLNHSEGFNNDTSLSVYYMDGDILRSYQIIMEDLEIRTGGNLTLHEVTTYQQNIFGQWTSLERSYIVTVPGMIE